MITVQQLRHAAAQTLHELSTTPVLDSDLLLGHVLGWRRAELIARLDEYVASEDVTAFERLVARRALREPVAYLIGRCEFFGLDLMVDRRVLVPRPETEHVVEAVLTWANAREPTGRPMVIADIGTGSGAIAIALAVHLPDAQIYAVDICPDALSVAAHNIAHHGVGERVHLRQGDMLAPVPIGVDVVVSNPPYTMLATIAEGVHAHEPHLALDGGADGLAVYRRLVAQIPSWVHPNGALILEIDATQGDAVSALVMAALPNWQVRVLRDVAGWERVVMAMGTR